MITTRISTGVMCGRDAVYVGTSSLFSETEQGKNLINDADAIMVIGADPETIALIDTCRWNSKAIIQIETDPSAMLTYTRSAVYADPVSALSALMPQMVRSKDWLATFQKIIPEQTGKLAPADQGINRAIALLGKATGPDDVIVADGAGISSATAYLLRNAEYRDLFCMDERDMPGVGLPFAIGAAVGNPQTRITLICDKESLFAHVRELSPALQAGVALRIIVADKEDTEVNCTDTASVLEGFGCMVHKFGNSDDFALAIPEIRPGAISALVIKT